MRLPSNQLLNAIATILLLLLALMTLANISSWWLWLQYVTPSGDWCKIESGRFLLTIFDGGVKGTPRQGWYFGTNDFKIDWLYDINLSRPYRYLFIPLWFIILPIGFSLLAIVLIKKFSIHRRGRIVACGNCGYDLHGLDIRFLCPECGSNSKIR